MAGQADRIFIMMFSLINVIGILSGMWWLLVAAHLLNFEKVFVQYLHNRKPDIVRLFDFLAGPRLRLRPSPPPFVLIAA
jgi:hypothetical protein